MTGPQIKSSLLVEVAEAVRQREVLGSVRCLVRTRIRVQVVEFGTRRWR